MAMPQVKRQRNIDTSSKQQTKKLKTTVNDRKLISCLENLSNELFYEIFEYLEGCQLYEAFSNLNIRFQNLLNSPLIQLKITFNGDSKLDLISESHIVASNKHRIISLRILDSLWSYISSPLFTFDLFFTRLESLQFYDIRFTRLIPILNELISLPRLFSFSIINNNGSLYTDQMSLAIFKLPVLKYFKLSYSLSTTFSYYLPPTNEIFSSIEYLVINHKCNVYDLMTILSHTPQLTHLTCKKLQRTYRTVVKQSIPTISSLTHIYIDICDENFDNMIMFITNISSNLQVLRINYFISIDCLNADRWEQIISEYLPHLRIFEFKYQQNIQYLTVTKYHQMIQRFNSPFWIAKKWFFRCIIDEINETDDRITYSIFSYREKKNQNSIDYNDRTLIQHNLLSNTSKPVDCCEIFSQTNLLTIIEYTNTGIDLLKSIAPILPLIPITCLNIVCDKMFVFMLANFIRYLPNVQLLVISSLIIRYLENSYSVEMNSLRSVATMNIIRKVNVKKVHCLTSLQLLLQLCPRIEYLQIDHTDDIFPETIIRFIFMQNLKYIPNLCLLCIKVSQINENLIEKIQKIIDIESLHHRYILQTIDNRIILRQN